MIEAAAPPASPAPARRATSAFTNFSRLEGPALWLAKALLRTTWFALIPALLTGLVLRYLVPKPWDPAAERFFLGAVARFAGERPIELAVGSFIGFAGMIQYWSPVLPGGRFLIAGALRQSNSRGALGFAGLLALAVLLALLVRTSAFQPYRVLSGSMLPSLRPGDYLGVNRAAFGFRLPGLERERRLPARGDLVVLTNPLRDSGPEDLVKRVIGLPGDQIRTLGANLFVNEWRVPNCYAGAYVYPGTEGAVAGRVFIEFLADRTYLILVDPKESTDFGPYRVKPGEAFVLGDHRSASADSRAWTDRHGRPGRGVPARWVQGRVDWVLARADRAGKPNLSAAFSAPGIQPEVDGVSGERLRAGIEQCLAKRPSETHPPAEPVAESFTPASIGRSVEP